MTSEELKTYQKLSTMGKETAVLKGISSLLEWDQETYMPENSSAARASQLELVSGLIHKTETNKRFASLLSQLIHLESGKIIAKTLSQAQKSALKEWRRSYLHATKLPTRFVKEFAKLTSNSMHIWAQAKQENSFKKFAPYLKRIIEMSREKAEYLGYKEHPYDALLDQFEPHMTTKSVQALFSELKKPIADLLKKISSKKVLDTSFLKGDFSHETQVQAGLYFLKQMNYDFKKGRLDISSHPFSISMHPDDSRITTRIDPHNFMSNISACMHEYGHALYEMGLPAEYFGTPLCEPISLGIHESQSRFWETRIGQSKPFWSAYFPYLKETFGEQLTKTSLDMFYKGINLVEPSFIRTDADEVTYSLHVILRFDLEYALIEGSLKVEDIPEAWNAKMQEYLGITPKTDQEGCLQDVHWSMGSFGYFPSYTLGNLYASHIFLGFERDFPDWEERIAKKDLSFIRDWLKINIHTHGKHYSSIELVEKVAGSSFSAKAFINYLQSKYSEIYR
ncbi:MAG: carboxypeptidase M32 [Chlamydiales bacterium]|nr:carboxypeptidase M32 [Chlamydiales bacterium]